MNEDTFMDILFYGFVVLTAFFWVPLFIIGYPFYWFFKVRGKAKAYKGDLVE